MGLLLAVLGVVYSLKTKDTKALSSISSNDTSDDISYIKHSVDSLTEKVNATPAAPAKSVFDNNSKAGFTYLQCNGGGTSFECYPF